MRLKRCFNLIRVFTQTRGFTLVELMVVVSIIGILVAIAIPIYRNNTAASERAVVEANLRILDSAIMHYVVAEGVYPVDNNDSNAMEWIIQNPSWNAGNKLEPFVSPFSSIKGERYVIYGAASAPEDAPISTNRAFIVLNAGDTIGGHTATGDEHYHLQNLPWKQSEPSGVGYTLQLSDGLRFTNQGNTGTATLAGPYTGTDKSIIIPKGLNGTIIKSIADNVFQNKGLESVIFADGSEIGRIHARAFQGNSLTEIVLPNNLITIDNNSFENNKLKEVALPDTVEKVEWDVFRNNQLAKIRIGNNVDIGNNAFRDNPLKEIVIGNGVIFGTSVFPHHDSFISAYEQGGAGTYKLVDGQWVKQ